MARERPILVFAKFHTKRVEGDGDGLKFASVKYVKKDCHQRVAVQISSLLSPFPTVSLDPLLLTITYPLSKQKVTTQQTHFFY